MHYKLISPSELESLDYKILHLVNKKGPISEKAICQILKADTIAVELRISLLSTPDHKINDPRTIPNSSYLDKILESAKDDEGADTIKYTGTVQINAFGKKALEDYKLKQKDENRKYWIHSVVTPIGVALITAILTTIATLWITKYLGIYL